MHLDLFPQTLETKLLRLSVTSRLINSIKVRNILMFILSIGICNEALGQNYERIFIGGGSPCNSEGIETGRGFHDDFDSFETNRWFRYFPDFPSDNDDSQFSRTQNVENTNQVFLDENVQVNNGVLNLIVRDEQTTWRGATRDYSSGVIHSREFFGYGTYEIRCRVPQGTGLWPAFWTFSGNDEIDIFEMGGDNTTELWTNIHEWFNGSSDNQSRRHGIGQDLSDDFHTYTINWTPFRLDFLVDNSVIRSEFRFFKRNKFLWWTWFTPVTSVTFGEFYQNTIFPTEFGRIIADVFIPAQANGFTGVPNSTTQFPAQMDIDYISVTEFRYCGFANEFAKYDDTVFNKNNTSGISPSDGDYIEVIELDNDKASIFKSNSVTVSPNPVNIYSDWSINLPDDSQSVIVHSIDGSVIKKYVLNQTSEGDFMIRDRLFNSPGMYIVNVIGSDNVLLSTKKLIVVR